MPFEKYWVKDNSKWSLSIWISADSNVTELILNTWEGANFTLNQITKLVEHSTPWDETTNEVWFENIKITWISWDALTIEREFNWTTARAFPSWSILYWVVHSEIISDIQDEVTRLETDKLDNWDLRTWLSWTNKVITSNNAWNETWVSYWTSWKVLTSTWATSEPTFQTIPEQKVYDKTTSDVDIINDFWIFSDTSNSNNNKKDKIINITRWFWIDSSWSIKMLNSGTVQTDKWHYSIFQEITLWRGIWNWWTIRTGLSCRSSITNYNAYAKVEVIRNGTVQQTGVLVNQTTSWNYDNLIILNVLPGDILRYSVKGIGNDGHIAHSQYGSIYYDIIKDWPDQIDNSNQTIAIT